VVAGWDFGSGSQSPVSWSVGVTPALGPQRPVIFRMVLRCRAADPPPGISNSSLDPSRLLGRQAAARRGESNAGLACCQRLQTACITPLRPSVEPPSYDIRRDGFGLQMDLFVSYDVEPIKLHAVLPSGLSNTVIPPECKSVDERTNGN